MIVDERRLWQAVILRAIQDAVWIDPSPRNRQSERVAFCGTSMKRYTAMHLRDEAVFWLLFDKSDFATVCDNAGLSPDMVRTGARKILEASDEQKASWSSDGFSLSDLRGLRELRPQRVDAEEDGGLVLRRPLPDDRGGAGVASEFSTTTE